MKLLFVIMIALTGCTTVAPEPVSTQDDGDWLYNWVGLEESPKVSPAPADKRSKQPRR